MKKVIFLLLLLSDLSFGQQVASLSVIRDFPQIAFGGDAGDVNYVTLLQLVNNNSAATTGRLTLYADDGSPLAALFDGQGPQSSMDIALAAGKARQIRLTTNGPIAVGW